MSVVDVGLFLAAVAIVSAVAFEVLDRVQERRRMRLFADAYGLEARRGETWDQLRARVAARSTGLRRSVS